jgi:hypothetical protein
MGSKKVSVYLIITLFFALLSVQCGFEDKIPAEASVNGKYANLIQVLNCPKDRESYGKFKDYGYRDGGSKCGKKGKTGYWVYVAPNWYVWANQESSQANIQPPPEASANGKYYTLIQVLNCPEDKEACGEFMDYGYWGGGPWCGKMGKAGYWVWVDPNWYIWANQE